MTRESVFGFKGKGEREIENWIWELKLGRQTQSEKEGFFVGLSQESLVRNRPVATGRACIATLIAIRMISQKFDSLVGLSLSHHFSL